jgi:predicted MFS family arabinose efflux permease
MIHNLEGRRHPLYFTSMGVLLVGCGFVVLNLFPALKLSGLVVILFITFGEMMSMPFMNSFWIARTSPNNRGAYAALYTMAWSLAQAAGPPVGSQIIQHQGFTVFWWILGSICATASFGFMFLYRFTSRQAQKAVLLKADEVC